MGGPRRPGLWAPRNVRAPWSRRDTLAARAAPDRPGLGATSVRTEVAQPAQPDAAPRAECIGSASRMHRVSHPAALGIDVGTTNTKAVLVALGTPDDGRAVVELASASAPTPDDALRLVDAVVRVVRAVIEQSGVTPDAVGVASMAETGVALDHVGRPLTPLLRWDGHRAAEEAAALARTHGRHALFRATGARPGAKIPLATWAWLRNNHPDVHARMASWAGAADLVVLALSGELVTDHTLAGRSLAYRLPAPGAPLDTRFDPTLLETVGLRPEQLPRVGDPYGPVGVVRGGPAQRAGGAVQPGAAQGPGGLRSADRLGETWAAASRAFVEAGLLVGTPVVAAGHDHAVGSWAAGVRGAHDRADSIGTAEAVLTVLPARADPRPERLDAVIDAGMSLVRTPAGDREALLAGTSSAGAMVGWLLRELAPADEVGRREPPALDDLFQDVLGDVLAHPAPGGTVVLPYLSGRQSPAPDVHAGVRVLHLGTPPRRQSSGWPSTRSADLTLARGVLEGLCLQARWMLTEQAALARLLTTGRAGDEAIASRLGATGADTGRRPITVLGGPAVSNAAWAELKARVMPDPLRWVTAREPVATGAALLAATRAGLLGDDVATLLSAGRESARGAPCLDATTAQQPASNGQPATDGAAAYDVVYAQFVSAALWREA